MHIHCHVQNSSLLRIHQGTKSAVPVASSTAEAKRPVWTTLGLEIWSSIYPLQMGIGGLKPPFSIGDTSSNGGFPIAMLVYRSVHFPILCVLSANLKSLMYIIYAGFPVEGRYPRGQLLAHDKNHDLGRQEHVSSHITWTFARGKVKIDLKRVSFFLRMLFKKCKEHLNHLKWKECTTNANGIAYHMLLYIYMRMGGATPIVNSIDRDIQNPPPSPTVGRYENTSFCSLVVSMFLESPFWSQGAFVMIDTAAIKCSSCLQIPWWNCVKSETGFSAPWPWTAKKPMDFIRWGIGRWYTSASLKMSDFNSITLPVPGFCVVSHIFYGIVRGIPNASIE